MSFFFGAWVMMMMMMMMMMSFDMLFVEEVPLRAFVHIYIVHQSFVTGKHGPYV